MKKRRLLAIAIVLVLPTAVGFGLLIRADSKLDHRMDRLRDHARAAVVTQDELLAATTNGTSQIAASLGVDPSEVSLNKRGEGPFCLTVTMDSFALSRSANFLVDTSSGKLEPASTC